jgi:hypothetical protein
MRIPSILLSFAALAILPRLVWPAGTGSKPKKAPVIESSLPASVIQRAPAAQGPDFPEAVYSPDDPFGEFLRKIRLSEDSLQYLLGERTFNRQRFDSALSHHLAAHVPASGIFRDTLLAQRSRIFARVWPTVAPRSGKKDALPDVAISKDSLPPSSKPVFDWGMGTSHSRGLFRTGPWHPYGTYGTSGMGYEERYWMYNTYARQSWPLSVRGQTLNLAANVNQSTAGGFSTFDVGVQADIPEGILENSALSLSTGLRKSQLWGSYKSNNLLLSKGWYSERLGLGFESGYSGEWNDQGKRLYDNAWVTLSRDVRFESGNTLAVSLRGAVDRLDARYDWITAPVLYVDDVSKAQPTHFRAQDYQDTLHGNTGDALLRYAEHAGEVNLTMLAPRSYFSFCPALQYGFSLPAGIEAMAAARYALDFYPQYAWDWAPVSDSSVLYNGDLVGLAFNRADGRYYSAVLMEGVDGLQEYYGTVPLEHRTAKRLDQRAGLEFSLSRILPHGYTLALEASAQFGWSNLPDTFPIESQPWQWGLTFNLSRSWIW